MTAAAMIGASALSALAAHETGHLTMARALGYPAKFARFGLATKWGSDDVVSPAHDRALVSLAGPLASLFFAVACWFAGFYFAAFVSLELALVNLAPLPCSDGFQAYTATRRHAAR